MNAILPIAESANHHPDIAISWKTVEVTLTTHSEGGVTDKDFALAEAIDAWPAEDSPRDLLLAWIRLMDVPEDAPPRSSQPTLRPTREALDMTYLLLLVASSWC